MPAFAETLLRGAGQTQITVQGRALNSGAIPNASGVDPVDRQKNAVCRALLARMPNDTCMPTAAWPFFARNWPIRRECHERRWKQC